jgi:signal peptidase I
MEPTFLPGDRLLVDPHAYRDRPPERGDLVVVADPADPERWLLKRVVGTPGDSIRVDRDGAQRTSARPVTDPTAGGALEEMEVPNDHVFLLSDRPTHTRDSRQFGPVHLGAVLGRVYRRTAPAHRVAWL